MRTLMKVSMDRETSNRAIQDGTLQKTMKEISDRIHPEAAYFTTDHGKRTAFMVFDLKDPSLIPSIAEPLFNQLGAEVDMAPVMNTEDLMKGLESIKQRKIA